MIQNLPYVPYLSTDFSNWLTVYKEQFAGLCGQCNISLYITFKTLYMF